ncbi:MAG: YihY/virulence factor BrkB family protein [Prevotella sp.]|nr:YihY/virulence factor BrkB family protein [Bacteroidales bacterium]MDD7620320.1 YihY/virulence factor BrkB family protein [Bacteroidales bacterium]MDY3356356.1 YihY/virulence factor BrkB family protein [Prevotella sp.]MDY5877225.1 YihY/virulence factor BrkB family protein [Prevotella sp.]
MRKQIVNILRTLWDDFTTKRVINAASTLTYSTLLAIVPVVAVIFAIARGFGYNRYIETWFRSTLDSQPQVAEVIIGFVNSYLVHTKSGIVFGVGLMFMLWTVIMLTRNIEQVFNDIWGVYHQRSIMRTFTDYLAMFFILPILIIVISGIMLFMTSISSVVNETYMIGPVLKFLIDALPSVMLAGIISILYVFMPNTHVRWRNVILPAIFAALLMQMLQQFYIHSQLWVSSYNAIYGSFAALPLFMLWLQFSWTIILVGAELTYTKQNLEYFSHGISKTELSHRHRLMLCCMIAGRICKRFKEGGRPYNLMELKQMTSLPTRIITDLIYDMQNAGILVELNPDGKDNESEWIPSESVENITVGFLISHLESLHNWTLDSTICRLMDSKKWRKALLIRHNYLKAQRDIKLYELA